jgi:hypothetical protein
MLRQGRHEKVVFNNLTIKGWLYGVEFHTRNGRFWPNTNACLSIQLDKELGETTVVGLDGLDVPAWKWLNR